KRRVSLGSDKEERLWSSLLTSLFFHFPNFFNSRKTAKRNLGALVTYPLLLCLLHFSRSTRRYLRCSFVFLGLLFPRSLLLLSRVATGLFMFPSSSPLSVFSRGYSQTLFTLASLMSFFLSSH
ncbi:hypothetical protein CSUI_004945, partial [Cystoisospora suis]